MSDRLADTIARLKAEGVPRAVDFKPSSPQLTELRKVLQGQINNLPFGSLVTRQTMRALSEVYPGVLRELLLWAIAQDWSAKPQHKTIVKERLWQAYMKGLYRE